VTLIFWGSWWGSHGGGVKMELKNLFTGLTSSAWARTVTQYCDAAGRHPSPGAAGPLLAQVITDPANPPPAPSDANLTAEAHKYVSSPSGPFIYGVPVIVTPPGTAPAYDTSHKDCGHHYWGQGTNSHGQPWIAQWADVPYGLDLARGGCWARNIADTLSIVAGHEWAETVTDPFVNSAIGCFPGYSCAGGPAKTAWYAAGTKGNPEIGDLCLTDVYDVTHTQYLFSLTLPTGSLEMQELWSNEAGLAGLQGKCVKGS
jgi:hypothetical protein